MSEKQVENVPVTEVSKDVEVMINTLNSRLPQNAPFVIQQVSEAVKLLIGETEDLAKRNLEMAISITEQISKFSQGDIVYNYVPIVLALLQDLKGIYLDKFDTINHEIPFSYSLIQQFVDRYPIDTKNAPTTLIDFIKEGKKNISLVILARLLSDVTAGKNALNVAYIMLALNMNKIQFTEEAFQFYVDILTALNTVQY
jgi:hypothetical protein